MTTTKTRSAHTRWRAVALPTEHGGWGFISEPLLLGLLLAPSWGGLALSIAAFAAFLLRHPLKLWLKDVRAGRSVPRTRSAQRFALIYGGVMAVAGLAMLWVTPMWTAWLPLLLAVPLMSVQLWHDVHNQGRSLTAELAGAGATGAFAAGIVLFGGWALGVAFGLWLAMAAKGVTAVLYVRSRLRLERDKPTSRVATLAAHGAGLMALVGATAYGLLPWTAPLAMGVLSGRAALGLSNWRTVRPPKAIGFQELAYGFGFVLLLVGGYIPLSLS